MFLLVLWIIVFVIAVAVIAAVSVRHFTELAAFDASSVPHIQEKSVKKGIAARRVFRGLEKAGVKFNKTLHPFRWVWARAQQSFRDRANSIADQYRHLEWKQKWRQWRGRSSHERRAHLLALLEEADEHRRAERYDEAEKKYIEIVSLDPKNVTAYVGLGKAYFKQDRWREAEETFTHVVTALDSSHELAWAFLGRTLKAESKWQDATFAYRKALKYESGLAKRWMDLGECYRELGKNGEAAAAYKKAALNEPNNPRVLDQLIEISIIAGDKRLAKEALGQLQTANPENQKLAEWEGRVEGME